MIVKLKETLKYKTHRSRTIKCALSRLLDTMIIGEPCTIEKLIGLNGKPTPNTTMRSTLARMCDASGIEYATQTGDNGEFIFYRYT